MCANPASAKRDCFISNRGKLRALSCQLSPLPWVVDRSSQHFPNSIGLKYTPFTHCIGAVLTNPSASYIATA
jgi:hypothetical protein